MPILVNTTADRTQVKIQGDLNIYVAAESKTPLLAALDSNTGIDVDLGEVDEIDCSGVQLMLMMKKEAARRNKQLEFSNHSAAVREVVDLLNLAGALGDPMLIPGDNA